MEKRRASGAFNTAPTLLEGKQTVEAQITKGNLIEHSYM
jgi:hypothetical protein